MCAFDRHHPAAATSLAAPPFDFLGRTVAMVTEPVDCRPCFFFFFWGGVWVTYCIFKVLGEVFHIRSEPLMEKRIQNGHIDSVESEPVMNKSTSGFV